MDAAVLREIGLTGNEIEIYLSLLRNGPCLVSRLVQDTGLNRTHVYDRLEKLTSKGLSGYVIRDDTKFFSAAPPEKLLSYLEEKKRSLEAQAELVSRIIPELKSLKKSSDETIAEVYRGPEGFKTMMGELVQVPNSTIYSIGYTAIGPKIAPVFYEQWTKKRVERKIRRKYVTTREVVASKAVKQPLTEIRVLPKEFSIPSSTIISGNNSYIFYPQEKEFTGIVIRGKGISKTNKAFFEFLWKKARPPRK